MMTTERQRLQSLMVSKLMQTRPFDDEAIAKVVEAWISQVDKVDVALVRLGGSTHARTPETINEFLSLTETERMPEFRELTAIIAANGHEVQIGRMTEERKSRWNYGGDDVDGICSCGWQFDTFHESQDSAEHSAALHVDHLDTDEEEGLYLQEDSLLERYGRHPESP